MVVPLQKGSPVVLGGILVLLEARGEWGGKAGRVLLSWHSYFYHGAILLLSWQAIRELGLSGFVDAS